MPDEKVAPSNNKVLVIGGGVGGIRAALDLAEAGRNVVLIDKHYALGGLMTRLDRTFPTNNCDLCTLSPHLSENGRELRIEFLSMTQLTSVEGEAGDFRVGLTTAPRYIDLHKCTACGECFKQFPECVRFTPGLDHRAPTCMRYPQATPYAFSIDMEKCKDVDALVQVCHAGAIVPGDATKKSDLGVGSILLAPGADVFDPTTVDTYGGGAFPNVVTSLEYERILSASGPTHGELLRPSDGKRPRRIAWIQCVGSRSLHEGAASYCSSACCMFALKEAMVTRERFHKDTETTIFFMDMRTCGKDYELYYQRAKNDYGVRLVRSRPHTIDPVPDSDDLSITFISPDGNSQQTEFFDMVVLSTGFKISPETQELSRTLGIELNEHFFAKTGSFDPVTTSRPGIYVCGLFESPKDIPETMVQASAAAYKASRHVANGNGVKANAEEFPPERDVAGEEPRIGVFVCDCADSIGGVIDVGELVNDSKKIPGVAVAEMIGHGCSLSSLEKIQESIRANKLNRVVIGGCSPRTHQTLFQDTLRRAGLNKYLVEIANIRDQATWVHRSNPEAAAAKTRELIRMAVAGVERSRPLTDYVLPMNKDVLVIGGGVSGMSAALGLADQGFKVYLAERAGRLGGMVKNIRRTVEGEDVQAYLKDLVDRTMAHERIQILLNAIVVDHSGMPGMFQTGFQTGPQMFYRQIRHGATILATGALATRPGEYLLDKHPSAMTQLELDALIEDNPEKVKAWNDVVMIQCVGSRIPENPNCSRVCCQAAVKNALRILNLNPEARVFVLYRDMRTFGFSEDHYLEARRKGVIFVRYDLDDKPEIRTDEGRLIVTFTDPILGRKLSVAADSLCLSTGMMADDEANEDLATIFHLPRTSDGYFLEEHTKLKPVDLPVPGFFVAGTAHSPKTIRESVAQAQAAAGRAQTLLARDSINLGAAVASVNSDKCAACLICVRACPFDVPHICADGYSEIDPAKCHGCGVCAAECPAKAIQLMQFEDDQLLGKLEGLLKG
ncbi:MAG: FAD-dependent oxidoreductase [Syntrophobacter sp.]